MKRNFTSVLVALELAGLALAAQAQVYGGGRPPGSGAGQSYINYGVVTTPPVIDALNFVNLGPFEISGILAVSNSVGSIGLVESGYPFSTTGTENWTNENLMIGAPGFRFDTATATGHHSAANFFNSGTITATDTPGFPVAFSYNAGAGYFPFPTDSLPIGSRLLVDASNIVNQGTMSVGSVGLIQMTGKNINLANGSLIAGSLSAADPNDFTGQTPQSIETKTQGFTVDPPEVYDLWWGATNGETLLLPWSPPNQPVSSLVGIRSELSLAAVALPVRFGGVANNVLGTFEPFVFAYAVGAPTNLYYNMVFVNTNFVNAAGAPDTNITASVGFTDFFLSGQAPLGDPAGMESIILFCEPATYVITWQGVTNAVYFMDQGAALNPMTTNINTQYSTTYSRPNAFNLSTVTPIDWQEAYPNNPNANFVGGVLIPYDPSLIYAPNNYVNFQVTMSNSSYAVQIGRNPEQLDGSFSSPVFTTGFPFNNFPDPTNEAGRVEIDAGSLNITNARIRAEGLVTLNSTNLAGVLAGEDWGTANAALTATNGTLLVSNIFPATFTRIRGDIYAWGVNWINTFTNAAVTNAIHYHVLIVDQNLRGNFASSIRDLGLRGANVVIADALRVLNSDVFAASNLTVSAAVTLTQNAGNLGNTNLENLRNLLVQTNGSITVDNVLDLGYPPSVTPTTPAQRKYSVLSVTNFGAISAIAPLIQALSFENDGSITAMAGGSLVINANSIGLSQAGINSTFISLTNTYIVGQTNSLVAGGNVSISAASLIASNSIIQAGVNEGGLGGYGSLTLNVTGLLTDNTPGTPTTNNVLANYWQTTAGFSLTAKPAAGDLFGTEIKSIVTGQNVANHVWAGIDYGATAAGYSNNVAIGRLVLDRQDTEAAMRFSGTGQDNGMYVDYLELDDASYSDYRNGLEIDPNLTIYFADANADPIKLEQSYPGRLVWVPGFAGPNSTALVPILGGGYCLMNAALAYSPDISSSGDGVPNAYSQYPLNNATNGDFVGCPSGVTILKALAARGTDTPANLVLSVFGQGSVTPDLKADSSVVMGGTYTLSAVPEPGWLFNGWTGTYPSQDSTVTFTMQPAITNVNLTANFIASPFPSVAGAYNGLFSVSGNITAETSGSFAFSVGAGGVFSGKLLIGPESYPFGGKFDPGGAATVNAKEGSTSLTVQLQLDTTGQTDEVSGSVAAIGGQWSASLLGHRAPAWTARNPAPQRGRYTMLLPGQSDSPVLPAGNSYGTVIVTDAGNLTLSGNLADGTPLAQAAPVSKGGQWPLYSYGAGGQDYLLGWIAFDAKGSGFSGNVSWIKAAGKTRYYAGGFSFQRELSGVSYTAPAVHSPALGITNATLILSGGNLSENVTNTVALQRGLIYSDNNGSVILNINPATGAFNGSFVWPDTHKTTPIGGVVLQSDGGAGGFFLGTNQGGSVLLQGN